MGISAVTVLIDTYNHERYIEESIDGSTDRTPEIVRKFAPHVRLIQKTNGGQASAFNTGIPEAKGKIVAFLDGDDWWAKEKLKLVTDYLGARPHIGVVGHGIYEFDSDTGNAKATIPQRIQEISFDSVEGGRFFRQMMCFFGTSRVTVRRNILSRVLPVPERIVVEADEFISFMSAAYSGGGLIQEPLTFYRLHSGNLFQIKAKDEIRQRRIQKALAVLADELRIGLASAGIAPDVTDAIVKPLDVGSKRLRLMLDGGKPWETFQTERDEFQIAYKKGSAGYRLFKGFVLACTLVMPPRNFYRLRDWYSRSDWRRVRGLVGEPVPNAEIGNVAVTKPLNSERKAAH